MGKDNMGSKDTIYDVSLSSILVVLFTIYCESAV